MSTFVFGLLIGVILTLFCIFCIDAAARDARISDSELEAWREWRERGKKNDDTGAV